MKEKLSVLIKPLGIFIICWTIQGAISFIEKISSYNVSSSEISKNQYNIDLSSLNDGPYYLSLGRPRAHCNAKIKDTILFRGQGIQTDVRENLGIGFSFQKDQSNNLLHIDCSGLQTGFKSKVAATPVVSKIRIGKIIQFTRELLDIYLPVTLSVVIFTISLIRFRTSNYQDNKIILIGSIALIYAFSLSYITRLFFNGNISSYIHVVAKGLFCFAAFNVISNLINRTNLLLKTGYFICAVGIILPTFGYTDLHDYYKVNFLFYTISFGWLFILSVKAKASSYIQSLSLTWFIVQCIDFTTLIRSTGSYYAPLFFCVTILMTAYSFNEINLLKNKIEQIHGKLISMIKSKGSAFDAIHFLAHEITSISKFERFSVYIDDYFSGQSDNKLVSASRIFEYGYNKITSQDKKIIFKDDRGNFIYDSIKNNNVIIQKSQRDNCWFFIVPIDNISCLCISNSNPNSKINIENINRIIELINPSIKSISLSFSEIASTMHHSLSKLKTKLSPGIHEREIGAIFVDIYNYSKFCENEGDEYAKFISSTYFPSLMKYMANFATPEVVRGDEIYFVVTKDLSSVEGSIYDQTLQALKSIDHFIHTIGTELCKNHGFPVQEFRIGSSIGVGNIVVDDVMVRTSGDHINRAKRLQDSAQKGEILMEGPSFDLLPKNGVISINRKTIVVKKNVVDAVRVGFKHAA